MVLSAPIVQFTQHRFRLADHQRIAFLNDVEVVVGDDCRNLQNYVFLNIQTRHFQVDPDQFWRLFIVTVQGYPDKKALANYPAIIHPLELAERITSELVRVVDVFNPSPQDHAFIPRAFHLPTAALIEGSPPAPGKLPSKAQLDAVFGYIGYDPAQTIVVSDHEGGGWAGRLAWTLDVIDHTNWLYLDGGIHAWQHAGFDVVQAPTEAIRTRPNLTINPKPQIDVEELLTSLGRENLLIWDVRSREEYLGLRPQAQRNGHIPGAVNIDWLELMDHHNALRLRDDLQGLLASHGITADRYVVTHCQTHHRSGLSYMVGRLLGFPKIRAYAGSWSEWGNRTDTPIET